MISRGYGISKQQLKALPGRVVVSIDGLRVVCAVCESRHYLSKYSAGQDLAAFLELHEHKG